MNPDPQNCFKYRKKVSFIIQGFDDHVLLRKKHVQNYEMPAKGMFRMLPYVLKQSFGSADPDSHQHFISGSESGLWLSQLNHFL
jgi:hypothetical protein